MTDLRYPIGPFEYAAIRPEDRAALMAQIAEAPEKLRAAVAGLTQPELDTVYRPGGWTVRQVVHHLADADLNWYIRTKLALTESQPVIKPYDEAAWAELADARTAPIETSLAILDSLHVRWVTLFRSLSEAGWARQFQHPERGLLDVDYILVSMVWHARHHTAHITELRRRGLRP
jgi:uncharacterized damage-inducible protein DinB